MPKKVIRDIDELWTLRPLMALVLPPEPELRDGEQLWLNMMARRTRLKYLWSPFRRSTSIGRLLITNERLVYETGRDPGRLWLMRYPEELRDMEVPWIDVDSVRERPWRRRFYWGMSALPGMTMVAITLRDGRQLNFVDLNREAWRAAMDDVKARFPQLEFVRDR